MPPVVIAIVPVAFTVVSPAPLLKVPSSCTFKAAVLRLAAPMLAIAPPGKTRVSAESSPVMVTVPWVACETEVPISKPEATTVAPLSMATVPVPATVAGSGTDGGELARASVAEGHLTGPKTARLQNAAS